MKKSRKDCESTSAPKVRKDFGMIKIYILVHIVRNHFCLQKYAHVYVCVYAPEAINNKWRDLDFIQFRAIGSNLKVGRPDNVISNSVAAGGFV